MVQLPGRRLSTGGESHKRTIPPTCRPPARRGARVAVRSASSSSLHLSTHPPFSCIPFLPRHVHPHRTRTYANLASVFSATPH
jgi:hypothetical protein